MVQFIYLGVDIGHIVRTMWGQGVIETRVTLVVVRQDSNWLSVVIGTNSMQWWFPTVGCIDISWESIFIFISYLEMKIFKVSWVLTLNKIFLSAWAASKSSRVKIIELVKKFEIDH